MIIMNKQEIEQAIHIWPANVKQPIDRDMQILLMKTSKERHLSRINKLVHRLEKKGKDNDPLG